MFTRFLKDLLNTAAAFRDISTWMALWKLHLLSPWYTVVPFSFKHLWLFYLLLFSPFKCCFFCFFVNVKTKSLSCEWAAGWSGFVSLRSINPLRLTLQSSLTLLIGSAHCLLDISQPQVCSRVSAHLIGQKGDTWRQSVWMMKIGSGLSNIYKYKVQFQLHRYADDKQLYMPVRPGGRYNITHRNLAEIHYWMSQLPTSQLYQLGRHCTRFPSSQNLNHGKPLN